MCEFCEKEKPIFSSVKQFHDRTESISFEISKNKLKCLTMLVASFGTSLQVEDGMKINYCPMCGRRFKDV